MKHKLIIFFTLLELTIFVTQTGISGIKLSQDNSITALDASEFSSTSTISNLSPVIIGDGQVSDVWRHVLLNPMTILGSGGGVYAIHDNTFLYLLIKARANMDWFSIQWSANETNIPITNLTRSNEGYVNEFEDFWIFGDHPYNLHSDGYVSTSNISSSLNEDIQTDLYWERATDRQFDSSDKYVYWEVQRLMITSDGSAQDIQFNLNSEFFFHIWSSIRFNLPNIVLISFDLSNSKLQFSPNAGDDESTQDVAVYFFTQLSFSGFIGAAIYTLVISLSGALYKKEVQE